MNILLVEDNEGDIELVKRAFKKAEVPTTLSVVNDGMEALEYLTKQGHFVDTQQPDLILLDLNMPRMGGREFLEAVKKDEKLRSIPVIMLTSSSSPKDIRDCYERHVNCYIRKPFDTRQFIDLVKQLDSFWCHIVQLPC